MQKAAPVWQPPREVCVQAVAAKAENAQTTTLKRTDNSGGSM